MKLMQGYTCFKRDQGQKFVAVFKAKNFGAATSQNDKNRGIVAAKIVKIAAVSRQKS